MNVTSTRRLLIGATAAFSMLVASCGSDDIDDANRSTDSVAEADVDVDVAETAAPDVEQPADSGDEASVAFCARIEELEAESEAMTDDERDAAFFSVVAELADAAPDPEVADALGRLAVMAERLDEIDEDDPDAFGEAFAMMFDPELLSALEQLETYLVEECGFEDLATEDTSEFATDGSDEVEVEIDFDEAAYDELRDDFDRVRDALDPSIEGSYGYGLFRFMGPPEIEVDVDLTLNDPLEVCESVAEVFDDLLSASGLPVTVNDRDEFEPVASRTAGGTCVLD